MSAKYWLLKAEPDSRIVKGKDVKFSVDDFERVKISPWEGVRNYEARNLMKEMQVGEKAVFYHSNCKNPGIAAFAEVAQIAYPDYTAWDESHPYYDSKSEKDNPKWFMVDLKFAARAKHFIPLALLRYIADSASDEPFEEIEYIGKDGVQAIRTMNLVTRGRLSIQRVEPRAWEVIHLLAENGGWEEMDLKPRKNKSAVKPAAKVKATPSRASTKVVRKGKKAKTADEVQREESPLSSLPGEDAEDGEGVTESKNIEAENAKPSKNHARKRKIAVGDGPNSSEPPRRSHRRKVVN